MSAEDVDNLIAFVGGIVTREEAAHILKLSNNDLNTAVNKVFEDGVPALMKQTTELWDHSAFNTDRYGQDGGHNNIPTFSIDYAPGVDHYPHSGGPSGAPTRPSSRTSHRSNVSTHAGDAPLQSIETGQESGIISTSGAVFGPANQEEYYDNAKWAMVPISKSVEYIPDASLWYLSRDSDAPAFLKPATSQDYLPALLTILHTIPLYRNALLAPNVTNDDYQCGDEWWKGNAQAQARMVDNDTAVGYNAGVELVYETQRLLAFLDNTQRSYASLDTLFRLEAWTKPRMSPEETEDLDDDLVKYLLRWSFVYKKHHPEAILDGVFRSTVLAGGMPQKSFVLDVPVVPGSASTDRHLYDVLDEALFDSPERSAHIDDVSDVLILRMCSSTSGAINCIIPSTLYAGRYLVDNKATVETMFAERKQHEEDIKNMDAHIDKLKTHRPQKSDLPQTMDTLAMIKTSMDAFDPEKEGDKEDATHASIFAQLKTLYESVQSKLSALEEEKEKMLAALTSITTSFRAPVNMDQEVVPDSQKHHFTYPYQLQGVATSNTDYYVQHPSEEQQPGEPTRQQWWHIKYSYAGESASIDRKKVTVETVCSEAASASGKVLLVYANEAALSDAPLPLSKPLEDFVNADNLAFMEYFQRHKDGDWDEYAPNEGNKIGDRDDGNDWNSISATQFHQRQQNSGYTTVDGTGFVDGNGGDSGMSSSRTLTPNTEVDEDEVLRSDAMEMQEVNGGIQAWAGGMHSNASSETVGLEPMEIVGESQTPMQMQTQKVEHVENIEHAKVIGKGDVDMVDVELEEIKEVKEAVREMETGTGVKEEPSGVEHIEVVEKKGG